MCFTGPGRKGEEVNELKTQGDRCFYVLKWIPLVVCKWEDGRVMEAIDLPLSERTMSIFGVN